MFVTILSGRFCFGALLDVDSGQANWQVLFYEISIKFNIIIGRE